MGAGRGLERRLVGRAAEWSAAERAIAEPSGGVVFAGPPGMGKTALARAVVEGLAEREDIEVLWLMGPGTEAAIPFGAFAPYVPDLGAKPGRQPDHLHLLQNFRAAVLRRAAGRSLVLAVDDANGIDSHSATLIFQLVTAGAARVVMTSETARPVPAPLRALWKEDLIERVDLGPLDQDSTVELVADLLTDQSRGRERAGHIRAAGSSAFESSVGGDVTEAIWRVARGTPLFVRELVTAGCQDGWIELRDGVWRLEGHLRVGSRLSDLIAEKLEPLSPAEMETLQLVALSDPLPLRVMLRLVRSEAIEALQAGGLITFDRLGGEQVARTEHPAVGEVVRASTPPPRAARIGLRLAEAFEADGRLEAELVRVTTWRLEGGADLDGDVLVRASRQASARQDWRASAGLAEAALRRGAGLEANLLLADAYRAEGRFSEALTVLGDERGHDDAQVAEAAVLRSSIQYFGFGNLADALETLSVAEGAVNSRSERIWLRAEAAGLIGFSGRPVEAGELAEKLLAEPGLTPRAESTVRAVLSLSRSLTGRPEEGLQVLEGIAPATDAVADLPAWNVTARVTGYRLSGQLDELERVAKASYDLGVHLHDPRLHGPAASALGWVALERARLPRAIAWFREAASSLRSSGSLVLRVPALVGLAEALALSGDVEGSRAALEDARPSAETSPLLMPAWSIAAAWLSAAQGAMSEAFQRAEDTAAAARAAGQTAWEIQALHCAVRLGSGSPADRLAELATWTEGRLVPVVAGHAAALRETHGVGDALDRIAERYADLGLHLYAAEAAAQACRAHQSVGQSRRAAASAARGHFLIGATDDGRPPLGLALALTPPELTRREREVAMLAARGLPSQAIANQLCLSVRTVETHLARVYLKLGIGSRSELAVALVAGAAGPGEAAG